MCLFKKEKGETQTRKTQICCLLKKREALLSSDFVAQFCQMNGPAREIGVICSCPSYVYPFPFFQIFPSFNLKDNSYQMQFVQSLVPTPVRPFVSQEPGQTKM